MAQRARLEGSSEEQQRKRTLERLHFILEHTPIPLENIRMYLSVPTCYAIIAHSQRKLFLNPYTISERAEDTLSLIIDGVTYHEAFDQFVLTHLERPWKDSNITIPFKEYITEENDEVTKSIADRAIEKSLKKNQSRPIFIAINGCTAAGKTVLSKEIALYIRGNRQISCTLVETDGWITIDRLSRSQRNLTGCHDEIYDIEGLFNTLNQLSMRQETLGRTYDNVKGISKEEGILKPGDIVIVDGLMSTHMRLRDFINISVWIQCTMDTHMHMREEKDIKERGYTKDQAEQNWKVYESIWHNFELKYKPLDCIILNTNRARMRIMSE
jgi:uridine kinase